MTGFLLFFLLLAVPSVWAGPPSGGPTGETPPDSLQRKFTEGHRSFQKKDWEGLLRALTPLRDIDHPLRDYVLYYLGHAELAEGNPEEGLKDFRTLLEQTGQSRWGSEVKKVLFGKKETPVVREEEVTRELCAEKPSASCFRRLSRAAAKRDDLETAIEANRTLLDQFPDSSEANEALSRIAFLYQDAGRWRESIPILKEVVRSRDGNQGVEARRRLAWASMRLKRYREALELLEDPLLTETSWGLFWRGSVLRKMGRGREAHRLLHQLIREPDRDREGRYYALRALEQIPNERHRFLSDWLGDLSRHRQVKIGWTWQTEQREGIDRVFLLTSFGLTSEAETELRWLRTITDEDSPLPLSPKELRKRGDHYEWRRRVLKEEDPEYPLPHAEILIPLAERLGIDPLLLYAMMRQESRYRRGVVSRSGAVGILQLLPETGRRIATEERWAGFEPEWLSEPQVNIELAVAYVRRLSKLFSGDRRLITAAYNAGEEVVARWLKKRAGISGLEFIEEIPYAETRDYVERVFVNEAAYRALYR